MIYTDANEKETTVPLIVYFPPLFQDMPRLPTLFPFMHSRYTNRGKGCVWLLWIIPGPPSAESEPAECSEECRASR